MTIIDQPHLYMAPILGATDYIYRRGFHEIFGGVDTCMAPFIVAVDEKKVRPANMNDLAVENNQKINLVPQILGNQPDSFITVAGQLHDMGYGEVNWNLGCPSPMVANKKRGSGLLPYGDRIIQILDKVIPSIKSELSIKLRLGYYDFTDEGEKLIKSLNDYPLKNIIIHPRTGKQMYKGDVDLLAFEKCLALSSHEIVYNGDICSVADYGRLKKKFPAIEKWMIGRGLLANPFLADDIKKEMESNLSEEELKRRVALIRKFHQYLFDHYSINQKGPAHLLNKMKGQWFYLSQFFDDGERFFKKIKKLTKVDNFLKRVDRQFDSLLKF